jgi:hypothetical protein
MSSFPWDVSSFTKYNFGLSILSFPGEVRPLARFWAKKGAIGQGH